MSVSSPTGKGKNWDGLMKSEKELTKKLKIIKKYEFTFTTVKAEPCPGVNFAWKCHSVIT